MSKSQAMQILRDNGLDFVKLATSELGGVTKCYTGQDGKRVKGIFCADTGPMTLTDIPMQRLRQRQDALLSDLRSAFQELDDDVFVVEENSRSRTILRVSVHQFPAYTYSAHLDESYVNHYLVPFFKKEKK